MKKANVWFYYGMNKKLDGTTASNYIDETNYNYTIRGWLKSMNGLSLTGKQHLGMLFSYNDAMGNLTNTAQWNGNISGIKWATSTLAESFGYAYSYDGINRLTKADFGRSTNWTTTAYDENNITYDANGNFLTYQRNDGAGALLDNMVYNYYNNASNKLRCITGSKSLSSTPNTTIGDLYQYDANGNLTKDAVRANQITGIKYNYLNLPSYIPFSKQSSSINYIYDAAGSKLCKKTVSSEVPLNTTVYYAGNMVYDASKKLSFVLTDEGRALPSTTASGTVFTYEFNVKDHLGNVRMVLKEDGTMLQENHYYPFGLVMKGLGTNAVASLKDKTSPKNNYLYNDKELQTDFDLNWEDYGARMLDVSIPGFGTMDPHAESYYSISPYAYCGGNPISRVDPTGMDMVGADGLTNEQWLASRNDQDKAREYQQQNKVAENKSSYTEMNDSHSIEMPDIEGTQKNKPTLTMFMSNPQIEEREDAKKGKKRNDEDKLHDMITFDLEFSYTANGETKTLDNYKCKIFSTLYYYNKSKRNQLCKGTYTLNWIDFYGHAFMVDESVGCGIKIHTGKYLSNWEGCFGVCSYKDGWKREDGEIKILNATQTLNKIYKLWKDLNMPLVQLNAPQ